MMQSTLVKLQSPVIAAIQPHLSDTEEEILSALRPLSPDYPGIECWFLNKVIPGVQAGTRKIIRIDRNHRLAAFGIAKKKGESKICTVRVMPGYGGRGLALKIFDAALTWLDTPRPHLTVSDRRHADFERILQYYGFKLTSVRRGLYLPDRLEYLYNEPVNLRAKD